MPTMSEDGDDGEGRGMMLGMATMRVADDDDDNEGGGDDDDDD